MIKTTYQFDIYGNRVESSSDGSYKKSIYNDKNQLTKIETNKGNNYFHYDKNGNISAIYYDDGYKESFKYDDYNQLTTIKNNLDKTVTYEYDGMGERISQHEEDDTIYQLKSYYEVSEDLNLQDYRDGLEESKMHEAYAALKAQTKARQENRGCTVTETKYRTHTYQKEDVDKTFVLDRSVEYSQVLQEGNYQSVYGLARLESEDTKYITGVNDTINLSITDNKVTEYAYDDYGNSEDIEEGFGYNGEHKDGSGLIYLRARYYNPRIGRFLQIDSYKGEENALATKNRYTYVANNPYKYDDPSGHKFKDLLQVGKNFVKPSMPQYADEITNIVNKIKNGDAK